MADAILQVFRMSESERSARVNRMRRVVRDENVFWWIDSFLRAGANLAARSDRVARPRHLGATR